MRLMNEQNQVDLGADVDADPVYGEMLVETFFRDYERFGRVLFPTITQDRGRRPHSPLGVLGRGAYKKEHR